MYINGQEIKRINLPDGEISHTSYALSSSGENALSRINIPLSSLVQGTNTIAIEIHNRNKRSSDISFDAKINITQ
ncbi:MAG: hypothetical protein NE330_19520 [Lentisphaeraceae bacterium]|nr:hypothetical protein [Lentisphaeraceae bacterium]